MELGFWDSLFPWFGNQGYRYFAPMELGFICYYISWFGNQGYRYFAPMELYTTKPQSGDIFVTPSVSSVNLATSWRNKSKINGE